VAPRKSLPELSTQEHEKIDTTAQDAGDDLVCTGQNRKGRNKHTKAEVANGREQPKRQRTPGLDRSKVESTLNTPRNDRSPTSVAEFSSQSPSEPHRGGSLGKFNEGLNNNRFGDAITLKPEKKKDSFPTVTAAQLTIPGMESGQTLDVQYENCPKCQFGEHSMAKLNFNPMDV